MCRRERRFRTVNFRVVCHDLYNLRLRGVALLACPEAQRPVWQGRRVADCVVVALHDIVVWPSAPSCSCSSSGTGSTNSILQAGAVCDGSSCGGGGGGGGGLRCGEEEVELLCHRDRPDRVVISGHIDASPPRVVQKRPVLTAGDRVLYRDVGVGLVLAEIDRAAAVVQLAPAAPRDRRLAEPPDALAWEGL